MAILPRGISYAIRLQEHLWWVAIAEFGVVLYNRKMAKKNNTTLSKQF
jgi:hypothetical protein